MLCHREVKHAQVQHNDKYNVMNKFYALSQFEELNQELQNIHIITRNTHNFVTNL